MQDCTGSYRLKIHRKSYRANDHIRLILTWALPGTCPGQLEPLSRLAFPDVNYVMRLDKMGPACSRYQCAAMTSYGSLWRRSTTKTAGAN
jgi:hypothetical protein